MTAFDAKQYRDSVLKPNSRGEGGEQLREVLAELQRDPASNCYAKLDLNMLFAVPTPVSDAELVEWRSRIEPALNKASQLPAAKLLKQLLELLEQQGKPLTDPQFWGKLQAEKQKLQLGALEKGVGQLKSEYPLGVVTLEELKTRLAAIGISSVTDGSIQTVAEKHGLSVHPEFELPTEGFPEALRPIWKQMGQHTAFRSVTDVLLLHRQHDMQQVTFIERVMTGGGPLSVADIEQARLKSEQGKDTDALQDAQKFLGAVKANCASDAELQALVLIAVVELASNQLNRGKPQLTVRDHLVEIGYDNTDASRLVAAIGTSSGGGSGPRVTHESVRELLRRGLLDEAERTLSSLPSDGDEAAEHAALSTQITGLKKKKQQALDNYRKARDARDFALASTSIAEAMALDQGDETLPGLRDLLPPAQPSLFQVQAKGTGTHLSWSAVTGDALNYTIVRTEHRAPTSASDGTKITAGATGTSFDDPDPIAGSHVFYGLFATRDGQIFSDPAVADVIVLPAPGRFAANSSITSTQLSWETPKGAAVVVITQHSPDGKTVDTEINQGSTLSVEGLSTGSSYRFTARAGYLLNSGRQFSDPVSITVVPREQASAVTDLAATVDIVDGVEQVAATWSPVSGYEIELWRFPRNADLNEGSTVDPAQLTALHGTRLVALPGTQTSGALSRARFAGINEVVRIAPLTITDTGCLVGYSVIVGSAPRATDLHAELFGDELRVSWEWPSGDYLMELAWQESGRTRTRRVTKARYRVDGGAKLANASAISDLTIATVARVDGDEWVSPAQTIAAPNTTVAKSASYSMSMKRALLGGKVTCQLTATSSETGFTIPAEIVLKHGPVMPFSADDGFVVETIDLDFSSAQTFQHTFTLSKQSSPYWVCVFSLDDSQLDPPPTSELKG